MAESASNTIGKQTIAQLPAYLQQLVLASPNAKVVTDTEVASALARMSNRKYFGGDYQDKDFFVRVAASLPDAYKIRFESSVFPGTGSGISIDLVDARTLVSTFAKTQNLSAEERTLTTDIISGMNEYFAQQFAEQGDAGKQLQPMYENNSEGLSPIAYTVAVGAQAIVPDTSITPAQETLSPAPPAADQQPTATTDTNAASAGSGNMFTPGASGTGGVGFTSTPPEEALRAGDINPVLANAEFNIAGLPGAETFAQDYRNRQMEWLNQLGMDASSVGLPNVEKLGIRVASQYVYGLNKTQVMAVQRMLGRAGYFNEMGRAYSTLGSVDDNTKMAWDRLLVDAARSRMTVTEYLKQRISTFASEAYVEYSDAAGWKDSANTFASQVLNRNLTTQEFDSFMRAVRSWEREAALGPTVTGKPQVNVEQQARAYFDEQFLLERAQNVAANAKAKYIKGERVQ